LLKHRVYRVEIYFVPLQDLVFSEPETVSETENLVDTGKSTSFDSRQRGVADYAPRVLDRQRKPVAHMLYIGRPKLQFQAPLTDLFAGMQKSTL